MESLVDASKSPQLARRLVRLFTIIRSQKDSLPIEQVLASKWMVKWARPEYHRSRTL